MRTASLDGNLGRGQGFHVPIFATECEPNLASQRMSASREFDAASGGTKCIASWVTFEMDAQQPLIHGELPFPDYPNHPNLNAYSEGDECQELNRVPAQVKY